MRGSSISGCKLQGSVGLWGSKELGFRALGCKLQGFVCRVQGFMHGTKWCLYGVSTERFKPNARCLGVQAWGV